MGENTLKHSQRRSHTVERSALSECILFLTVIGSGQTNW